MRIEKGIKESIQILLYPGDDGKYVILSCRNIRRTYFVDENEGITGEFRKDNFVLIFYLFFFLIQLSLLQKIFSSADIQSSQIC